MHASDLISEDEPVVDEAALARLRALAQDVAEAEEDVVSELLRTFQSDAEVRIRSFAAALTGADGEGAADAVHALKGASATIGARRLSALCAALERWARRGDDLSALEGGVALLERELSAATKALAQGLTERQEGG